MKHFKFTSLRCRGMPGRHGHHYKLPACWELQWQNSFCWGVSGTVVCACRYREVYAMYKKAVASFWTVEEVDLSQDLRDWERLSGVVLLCLL